MNNKTLNITLITHPKNWMEQQAVNQLNTLASLPGVIQAVGLPDLHPGRTPVGISLLTRDYIYPHIIGSDIGCGMGLYKSGIDDDKARVDKWAKDLIRSGAFHHKRKNSGGWSIGGGNHFAELQAVDTIYDKESFNLLGLNENELTILVHSGSRRMGQAVLNEFKDYPVKQGLNSNSKTARAYLEKHAEAVAWAAQNRGMIASNLLALLGRCVTPKRVLDNVHNSLSLFNNHGEILFIHRKGSAAPDDGFVVIPGSRGSLTYLVKATECIADTVYSLAHGAGRKWQRSVCRARLRKQYHRSDLIQNRFKGQVVCSDLDLLYEEAPEAYKNIDYVIQALVDHNLAQVVATFKPVLTVKG